jgi:hypothetical protein
MEYGSANRDIKRGNTIPGRGQACLTPTEYGSANHDIKRGNTIPGRGQACLTLLSG